MTYCGDYSINRPQGWKKVRRRLKQVKRKKTNRKTNPKNAGKWQRQKETTEERKAG